MIYANNYPITPDYSPVSLRQDMSPRQILSDRYTDEDIKSNATKSVMRFLDTSPELNSRILSPDLVSSKSNYRRDV